jgi:hypothetical protein
MMQRSKPLAPAKAIMIKLVKLYAVTVGDPPRQNGWIRWYEDKFELPISGVDRAICKATGQPYILMEETSSLGNK